jgi:hypothetical protein
VAVQLVELDAVSAVESTGREGIPSAQPAVMTATNSGATFRIQRIRVS